MVGVFASLKWRLVTRRVRSRRGWSKTWMLIGWCVCALLILGAAFGLAVLRGDSDPSVPRVVVTTLFTAQFLAWGVMPLVAFGVDETVDPARFALLPISAGDLQRGVLVTAAIGYLPAANAVVLLGCAVALSTSWWMLPIAIGCALAQLLLCIIFSRALATAMSALMSGRRGRDLGVMVSLLIFVVYLALNFVLNQSAATGRNPIASGARSLSGVLSWLPPGALAGIPEFVRDGCAGRVAVAVVTVALALAVLWLWWSAALRRALVTVPSMTEGAGPVGRANSAAIADGPRGAVSVIAARDRTLTWRDPIRRVPWFVVLLIAAAWPFLVVKGHGAVYAVALGAIVAGMQASNYLAIEGSGLWLHVVVIGDRMRARAEYLGHVLAVLVPGTFALAIGIVIQAIARSDWKLVPGAAGLCLSVLTGTAAGGGWLSAVRPFPVPQSRKSMFASSIAGYRARATSVAVGAAGVGLLTAIPAAAFAVVAFIGDPLWGWAGLATGVLASGMVTWWLSGRAATRYVDTAPEILAVVSVGDRA